jgi:hypothetical protein
MKYESPITNHSQDMTNVKVSTKLSKARMSKIREIIESGLSKEQT